MKPAQVSHILSFVMLLLGLGGAIYSGIEWMHAPASSSLKYAILFVMWLVLGVGWGSRLLPNGPGESRKRDDKGRPAGKAHFFRRGRGSIDDV